MSKPPLLEDYIQLYWKTYTLKGRLPSVLYDGTWCDLIMLQSGSSCIFEFLRWGCDGYKWMWISEDIVSFDEKREANEYYKKLISTRKISKRGKEYYKISN